MSIRDASKVPFGARVRNLLTGKVGEVVDPRRDPSDPLPTDRLLVDFARRSLADGRREDPIWCLTHMLDLLRS